MADRNLSQPQVLDKKVVSLFAVVTFGASGAVASSDELGMAVTKPAGTGLYRATLEDVWPSLIGCSLVLFNGGTAADRNLQLAAVDLPNRTIDFQYISGTAAANATSGHQAYIRFDFRNTTVPRKGLSA